jgi:hypothetical protein
VALRHPPRTVGSGAGGGQIVVVFRVFGEVCHVERAPRPPERARRRQRRKHETSEEEFEEQEESGGENRKRGLAVQQLQRVVRPTGEGRVETAPHREAPPQRLGPDRSVFLFSHVSGVALVD